MTPKKFTRTKIKAGTDTSASCSSPNLRVVRVNRKKKGKKNRDTLALKKNTRLFVLFHAATSRLCV